MARRYKRKANGQFAGGGGGGSSSGGAKKKLTKAQKRQRNARRAGIGASMVTGAVIGRKVAGTPGAIIGAATGGARAAQFFNGRPKTSRFED